MAYGDIGAAVLDTSEFETNQIAGAQIEKVGDGIIAVWYSLLLGGGVLSTYPVAADGTVGAQIDTWVFEAGTCGMIGIRLVQKVATGIYLLAYNGPGNIVRVQTHAISAAGAITSAAIDSADLTPWTVTSLRGGARKSTLNVYAFVGSDGAQDGHVVTITCDADGDNIAQADVWEFQPTRAYMPNIAWITEDIFAVCYTDTSGDMQLETFAIDDSGVITEAIIDTEQVHTGAASMGDILRAGVNDLVLVGFQDSSNDGQIMSYTIDSAGTITDLNSRFEFEGTQASHIRLYSLRDTDDVWYFFVWYTEPSPDDVTIRTFSMDSAGTLSAQIDELQVRGATGGNAYACAEPRPDIWVLCYSESLGSDGTFGVVDIETVPDYSGDGVFVELAGIEVQSQAYGIRTERGRETELGYAPAGVAELTMDNSSGDFSPENAGGVYFPTLDLGNSIYIYEIYGGVTYPIFTGKIEKIVPQAVPGDGGAEAFILCTDGTDDLNDTPVETALRTDVRAGQLVTDILDAATAFVAARDIDTGISTFELAYFSSPSALKEIRTVEDQERGRFYVDVDGDAQFEDRHHRILNHRTSEYDFGEKLKDIQYEWSKRDLFNFIQIAGIQYTADADNLYLWGTVAGVAGLAVVVPGNGSVTIWATFSQVIASFAAFVQGTHWNTNTAVDKSGTDTSGSVTVAITQYTKVLKIKFTSTFAADSYLVVPDAPPAGSDTDRSAIIMGKLYQEDVIQHTDEDAVSIAAYGRRGFPLAAPFISDPEKLKTLAAYLKARFKDPQPMAIRVTVHGRTDWPTDDILKQVLSRKISDRITLASTLLGFDQDFYIEKVIHDWKQFEGKFDLDVTWVCSRASEIEDRAWLLEIAGFGELEETTYLSY